MNIFHISYIITFHPFLYFLFRSTRDKGNMNATGASFDLEDVSQFMDFKVFESALGS